MKSKRIARGIGLALVCGLVFSNLAISATKSKKELEAELAVLQEENIRLRQQIDELNSKLDLLMSRIDALEKSLAELKGPNAAREQIKEETIVVPSESSKVTVGGQAARLPVVKLEPSAGEARPAEAARPAEPQTKKVIVFGENKANPDSPIIKIEKESTAGTKKPAPEAQGPVTKVQAEKPVPTGSAGPANLAEVKKLIDQKQYPKAEDLIQSELAKNPSAKDSCALYKYLGDARAKSGKDKSAVDAYLLVSDKYPACDLAPESMFKAGELVEKTDKNKSKRIFEDLISLYPFSNYANLAEAKLKD